MAHAQGTQMLTGKERDTRHHRRQALRSLGRKHTRAHNHSRTQVRSRGHTRNRNRIRRRSNLHSNHNLDVCVCVCVCVSCAASTMLRSILHLCKRLPEPRKHGAFFAERTQTVALLP